MKKYDMAQVEKLVQPVIEFMATEYPNNYELVIDGFSAQLRSRQTEMAILTKDKMGYPFGGLKDVETEPGENDKKDDGGGFTSSMMWLGLMAAVMNMLKNK